MPDMYILRCADGSYYTGSTWNFEKRLWEHQQGLGARHTAKRLPVELLYFEEYSRIDEAFFREKQIQGWSRKKKEALMARDFDQLHQLAACRNESSYLKADCAGSDFVGFNSVGFDCAQPAEGVIPNRSLSEVEGSHPNESQGINHVDE